MLMHMTQESEGIGLDSIKLTGRTVNNILVGAPCHSGIRLGSDGTLYLIQPNGGVSAVIGQWLVVGDAADFYASYTITDGTLETTPGAEDTFFQLNADRDYDNIQAVEFIDKETTVFFQISSDVSGTPVLASASMTFISRREDFS